MRAADIVIAVGWIAFWLYWFVASIGTKKSTAGWGRGAAIRLSIVVVVVVLFQSGVLEGRRADGGPWIAGIGLLLFVAGLAVAVWARRHLGRNWGMPMTEKADPELVTTGPYRRVRHPIYSGIILAGIGTAVAVNWYWLIVCAVAGSYFLYSAVVEERRMTDRFPDAYPPYKRATKMLVPFVF